MSNGPYGDDSSSIFKNFVATAALGLFSWHLYTLTNISNSVQVLIEKVSVSNERIERLETEVFFKNNDPGKEQIR